MHHDAERPRPPRGWTFADLEHGERLARMGKSPAQIGRAIRKAPNTVAAVAERLGWPVGAPEIARSIGGAAELERARQRSARPAEDAPAEPIGSEDPAPTQPHASRLSCAYVFGDRRKPDWQWCGAPTRRGSPYCAEHHARCHERRDNAA